MDIIKSIEHEQMKSKIPSLKVGDTVKVYIKVKEGNKERIQVFEGIIIKKQGGGVNATFTVRRVSYGIGVEKTFLIHSPVVEKVEVTRVGTARRAKLFYLRDRLGKSAKTKEKVGAKIETTEIQLKEEAEEVIVLEEEPAIEVEEKEVVTTIEEPVVEAKVEEQKETVAESVVETTENEAIETVTEAIEVAEEEATEETKPEAKA